MQSDNPHRRPIPLFCNQPLQPQNDFDDIFYFPPIRERKSSPQNDSEELSDFQPIREQKISSLAPSPPAQSRLTRRQAARTHAEQLPLSSEESQPPPQLRSRRRLNKGLGQTNILNRVDGIAPVEGTKNISFRRSKSSFKRDSGTQDVVDERQSKKQRLAFGDEDEETWALPREIADVKASLERITAEAREDRRDIKQALDELLYEIQQRS